jgi:hypothetical protein
MPQIQSQDRSAFALMASCATADNLFRPVIATPMCYCCCLGWKLPSFSCCKGWLNHFISLRTVR